MYLYIKLANIKQVDDSTLSREVLAVRHAEVALVASGLLYR